MFKVEKIQRLILVVRNRLKNFAATADWTKLELSKVWHKAKYFIISWCLYIFLTWLLFCSLEPETSKLKNFLEYFYFQATITSTVGTGDVVPISVAGRFIAACLYYMQPAVFYTYFVWIAALVLKVFLRIKTGDIIVSIINHIALVSFQRERTEAIVKSILSDKHRENLELLLCFDANKFETNPLLKLISGRSVKTGFKSEKFLQAGCIDKAARILVDTGDDNRNISLCVIFRNVNPRAHIVVVFDNWEKNSKVIKHLSQDIECVPASLPTLIAKAVSDPGSSYTFLDMLDDRGQSGYHMYIPTDFKGCKFEELSAYFSSRRALILSIGEDSQKMETNPPKVRDIKAGMRIEYLRTSRFTNDAIDWSQIG